MPALGEETAYLFRHALLRDAAYQLQVPADRAALHGRAADALRHVHGDRLVPAVGLETVAHLQLSAELLQGQLAVQARTGRVDKTTADQVNALLTQEFQLLEPVAAEAMRRRDLVAHVRLRHRQCTHPLQPEAARPASELVYAVALRMTGRVAEAEALHRAVLQRAQQSGDAQLEGRAMAGLATICQYTGRTQEAERLTLGAIDSSRQQKNFAFLTVQLGNYGSLLKETGRVEEAIRYTQEAIEAARQTGQHAFECRFMANLAACLADAGRSNEAVGVALQAIPMARHLNAPDLEGVCRGNMASALAALGRSAEADAEYEQALQLAASSGDYRVAAIWASVIGLRAIRRGALTYAESLLHSGEAFATEANTPVPAARCRAMLCLLAVHAGGDAGDLRRALQVIRSAHDIAALKDVAEAATVLGVAWPSMDDGNASRPAP